MDWTKGFISCGLLPSHPRGWVWEWRMLTSMYLVSSLVSLSLSAHYMRCWRWAGRRRRRRRRRGNWFQRSFQGSGDSGSQRMKNIAHRTLQNIIKQYVTEQYGTIQYSTEQYSTEQNRAGRYRINGQVVIFLFCVTSTLLSRSQVWTELKQLCSMYHTSRYDTIERWGEVRYGIGRCDGR